MRIIAMENGEGDETQVNEDMMLTMWRKGLESDLIYASGLPPDAPERHKMLLECGNEFYDLFETHHTPDDIHQAIRAYRADLESVLSNSDRIACLNNLGNALTFRFRFTNLIGDISEAISCQQLAVELSPEGHDNLHIFLANLGHSFRLRFILSQDLHDISASISLLQKAVELSPKERHRMCSSLASLGSSLRLRFERSGDITDISAAISAQQEAVNITPQRHRDRPQWLNNLGNSLLLRFTHSGNITDISEAISAQQWAVGLTPEANSNTSKWLSNLATSLELRFVYRGDPADISESILAARKSVASTDVEDLEYTTRLSILGIALMRRFDSTKQAEDVDEAVGFFRKVVEMTAVGNIDFPDRLNNLGNALSSLFESNRDSSTLSESIIFLRRAVALSPQDHPKLAALLGNLGNSLRLSFMANKRQADISDAILSLQRAVELTPEWNTDASLWLSCLGDAFESREELHGNGDVLSDGSRACLNFRLAASHSFGRPAIRFDAASRWAAISHLYDSDRQLEAYKTLVGLLSQVASLQETVERRYAHLTMISGVTTKAAAVAISKQRPDLALEWLEEGRCLVWAQLNQLRTPVDRLSIVDQALSDSFLAASRALELSGSRQSLPYLLGEITMSQKIAAQDAANAHVKFAKEREILLSRIRQISGFEDFLRPPKHSRLLKNIPPSGYIIVINAYPGQCDAIILEKNQDVPFHIPLNGFSYEEGSWLRAALHSYLRRSDLRTRDDYRGPREVREPGEKSLIHDILEQLWSGVVKPIFDGVGFTLPSRPADRIQIWWCATGPLAFLPLHAAGIYGDAQSGPGCCVSDFAVSSYTPTVSALLEKSSTPRRADPPKMLFVSQPNTRGMEKLPGTTAEVKCVMKKIETKGIESEHLDSEQATINEVMEKLVSSSYVHLACHAIQDTANPLQSAFYLHDGRLDLSEIMKHNIPNAEIAFLSACQTSTGDEKLSEEAVHLAAGMLAAGYKGVVATMWSIRDQYGPEVAEEFYGHLFAGNAEEDGEKRHGTRAAYALQVAIQKLRARIGDSEEGILAWVPYVHFGI